MGDPPETIDDSAIERSVHRARGSPRRLLLVTPGVTKDAGAVTWDAVEALVAGGWAVTVVSPAVGGGPDFSSDRSTPADRMADLGVDLRADVDEVLTTTGTDWDVVVTDRHGPVGAAGDSARWNRSSGGAAFARRGGRRRIGPFRRRRGHPQRGAIRSTTAVNAGILR